jgi:hypothetical protein
MAGQNALMRTAQSTGGSPYDEDAYMRIPVPRRRKNALMPKEPETDMEMEEVYGTEDQVAYDQNGRPIPLADPRHPRNQRMPTMPTYPQVLRCMEVMHRERKHRAH